MKLTTPLRNKFQYLLPSCVVCVYRHWWISYTRIYIYTYIKSIFDHKIKPAVIYFIAHAFTPLKHGYCWGLVDFIIKMLENYKMMWFLKQTQIVLRADKSIHASEYFWVETDNRIWDFQHFLIA